MYICIYVYMYIHPTPLDTPQLCNCQQLVEATHDN